MNGSYRFAEVSQRPKKQMQSFGTKKLRCLVPFVASAFWVAVFVYQPAEAVQNTTFFRVDAVRK
jgi:Co/Zn/Cd efflux system component